MKTLSRMCGAPWSEADTTAHSASYPISERSPRTRQSPLEVSIGEFSTRTYLGRTWRTILAISLHSPEASPSIPAPRPAMLMSVHGNPPVTISTHRRQGRPQIQPDAGGWGPERLQHCEPRHAKRYSGFTAFWQNTVPCHRTLRFSDTGQSRRVRSGCLYLLKVQRLSGVRPG